MPIHDYYCEYCGNEFEAIVAWNEYTLECPKCLEMANRIYKEFNGIKHDAPSWLQDTLEVVDKDGGQHCKDFLKHPNRQNYHNWMKTNGLRPMEEGEKFQKPSKKDKEYKKMQRKGALKDKFKARESITIGGNHV